MKTVHVGRTAFDYRACPCLVGAVPVVVGLSVGYDEKAKRTPVRRHRGPLVWLSEPEPRLLRSGTETHSR